jgi:quinone-modifying oxidoreductase subunit QmoA
MLTKVAATSGVKVIKGKVGKVERNGDGGLSLRLEDVASGRLVSAGADLVVLATGMVPNLSADGLPFPVTRDEDGFCLDSPESGLCIAGVARRPEDVAASVRDATGAACRAFAAGRRA